jgi:hypothetical protein
VRVSEGSATGIDPRFDPRFQRGYVPEAAAVPPATDAPSAPVDIAPARGGDTAPPEAASALVRESAEARVLGSSAATTGRASPGPIGRPAPPTDDAAAQPDAVGASDDPFAEEDALAEEERLTPTRWMWIALGACVAFVVVGAVAFWVQASDPANYIGGVRAGIDETFRLVINALAPALVQAGLIGIVVVLVTWAVRGRTARAPEDRP